jgi:predicted DNA-binding transcriptional regulator YafY
MTDLEYLTTADVAERMGLSDGTIRRAIRAEVEQQIPDWARFVPGGRKFGTNYKIVRATFETSLAGELVPGLASSEEAPREVLELHITGTWVAVDSPIDAKSRNRGGIHVVPKAS